MNVKNRFGLDVVTEVGLAPGHLSQVAVRRSGSRLDLPAFQSEKNICRNGTACFVSETCLESLPSLSRLCFWQYLSLAWKALLDLVFPVSCGGCGLSDTLLCDRCRAVLFHPPSQVQTLVDMPSSAPVWTLSLYQGIMRNLVLAAKHSGAEFYQQMLSQLGFCVGQSLAGELEMRGDIPLLVTNCPSKKKFWGARRNQCALNFARGLSAGIGSVAPLLDPIYFPILELTPRAEKQSGKTREERLTARRNTMRLSPKVYRRLGVKQLAERQILVVDDVITTGATMREAQRVILINNAKVAGFISISVVGKPQN